MTAAVFADLVQARRTGAGRWKARCPAHNDRSPSLSIREGKDGHVTLYCRAGCSLDAIVAALHLVTDDLSGPQPSPAQQAAIRAAQQACLSAARGEHQRIPRWPDCFIRRLTSCAWPKPPQSNGTPCAG